MPSASKARRDLDERLNALIEANPELGDAVAFHRRALVAMGSVREQLKPDASGSAGMPEAEEMRSRMSHGLPALAIEQMQFPIDETRTLLYDLCCILEDQVCESPLPEEDCEPAQAAWRAESAHRIRSAIEAGTIDIPRILRAAARGDTEEVGAEALRNHLDAGMLRTLAHNSVRPVLQQWSELAAPEVALPQWQRGTCPICGSVPALGELPTRGPGRHLRCGMCGARWAYPREQCAFCGNADPASLRYERTSQVDAGAVQTCDVCRGYVKCVVTRAPVPVEMLPLEDLATLELDLLAAQREQARNAET